MKYIYFVFLALFSLASKGQELNNESISIIKTILPKTTNGDLLPDLGFFRYRWIKQNLSSKLFAKNANSLNDIIKLSDEERIIVERGLETASDFRWTQGILNKANIKMKVVMMELQGKEIP